MKKLVDGIMQGFGGFIGVYLAINFIGYLIIKTNTDADDSKKGE